MEGITVRKKNSIPVMKGNRQEWGGEKQAEKCLLRMKNESRIEKCEYLHTKWLYSNLLSKDTTYTSLWNRKKRK